MGATPIYALPYPERSDPALGAEQIRALANRIEAIFQSGVAPTVPIGAIIDWVYASGSVPAWALLCYGQNVSRTTYAALAALANSAGYPHGSGDGSTTFGMPDLRGRALIGKDDMGGTAASRVTAAISGTAGTVLGAAVGTEGVTLTTAAIPAHNHGGVTGNDSPDHAHHAQFSTGTVSADHGHSFTTGDPSGNHQHIVTMQRSTGYGLTASGPGYAGNVAIVPGGGGTDVSYWSSGVSAWHTHSGSTGGISANHTHDATHDTWGANARHAHSIGNDGSGGVHANMPPSLITNKMMRVL